ncbi:MAG TPA: glycosyltransferase family 4 protein [Victivallales bacterium]|nr:glycosyltransferase family 4 protein [Victivallales bacterium]HRR28365.1 glycosyltransferase family 4 protein [Victivallales bacterium]
MQEKIKIGWIETGKDLYGGHIYNASARDVISKYTDLKTYFAQKKRCEYPLLSHFEIFKNLLLISDYQDFWIRDIVSLSTIGLDKTRGENIALIHHDDFSGYPLWKRLPARLLLHLTRKNIKKCKYIITVSKFWSEKYSSYGKEKVRIIYNPFKISDYNLSKSEVEEFLTKYQFSDKPIIYLGNCHKAKGIVEAYNALKELDKDVNFVTSGYRNLILPVRHLQLSYKEYLQLLKASTLVLTMSLFDEGWCRTAHEAMLLGTPVVGSGRGGMRELLEGGKQIICEKFCDLKKIVTGILSSEEQRKELSSSGRIFAEQFSFERFEESWKELLNSLR